ncbi:hydrogenase expression/formation C-terminal domain-containing protein, partial [Staphylococcus gallinarum]|uniref:hydrogenase expression/formation C-terminal domain-containing protein n=1 Tax=Staphylococcus gallinarum TaxID=1293 RepID=UPI003176684F
NRRLLGQILGEGEVSARIAGEGAGEVLIQESVFAGVWRVIDAGLGDDAIQDYIEVGAAPHLLVTRALAGVQPDRPHVSPLSGTLADGVMNAP